MRFIVLAIFGKYCIRHILCGHSKIFKIFNNISDRFRKILAILQYFQEIFLQYFLNISVLCGFYKYNFFEKPNKKITIKPELYCDVKRFVYRFFILAQNMETEKWPKAVDFPLHSNLCRRLRFFFLFVPCNGATVISK